MHAESSKEQLTRRLVNLINRHGYIGAVSGTPNGDHKLDAWRTEANAVLRALVGDDHVLVTKFEAIRYDYTGTFRLSHLLFPPYPPDYIRKGLNEAVAILMAIDITEPTRRGIMTDASTTTRAQIFIVHGHDDGLKETVARFLARLVGQEPIILHEQVSGGATIIEKLERFAATARYAVVLATPDDLGRAKSSPDELPRARQNVIFELGYFFAELGRGNVALLYKPGVERPGDTDGIVHIAVDEGGAWKSGLCREIEAAGISVDRTAL